MAWTPRSPGKTGPIYPQNTVYRPKPQTQNRNSSNMNTLQDPISSEEYSEATRYKRQLICNARPTVLLLLSVLPTVCLRRRLLTDQICK